jgi:hypothetical protein
VVASWHVVSLGREDNNATVDLLVNNLCAPLLVKAQHPVKDPYPNTIQAPQHVLLCPHDLGLPAPPLKRLPPCVLARPIARSPAPTRTRMPFCISRSAPSTRAGSAVQMRAACFSSRVTSVAGAAVTHDSWFRRGGGRGRLRRGR